MIFVIIITIKNLGRRDQRVNMIMKVVVMVNMLMQVMVNMIMQVIMNW